MPGLSLVLMTLAGLLHVGFFVIESLMWRRMHSFFGGSDILLDDNDSLLVFCALFMVGAAVVLVASNRTLWRGALLQGGLPAIALLLALVV
jgi:uncharacterized membrane protein